MRFAHLLFLLWLQVLGGNLSHQYSKGQKMSKAIARVCLAAHDAAVLQKCSSFYSLLSMVRIFAEHGKQSISGRHSVRLEFFPLALRGIFRVA